MTRQLRTAEALGAFLATRRAANLSSSYESWLTYMLRHLAAAHRTLPTEPAPLELILAGLKNVGDETKYDVWVAMRTLYNWTAGRFGTPNPMNQVRPPRRRRKVPRTTDAAGLALLLANARGHARDYAILQLLIDTGARIGELANLTRADITPGQVRLTGKTGTREVPISAETHRALLRLPPAEPPWTGQRGPLTVDGLKRLVTRRLRQAGLPGGPHLLRHTFGRLWVTAGGNPLTLQRVMGHSRLEMTQRYVNLDLTDVANQHARFSPAARLIRLAPDQGPDQAASG
jgi:integrase